MQYLYKGEKMVGGAWAFLYGSSDQRRKSYSSGAEGMAGKKRASFETIFQYEWDAVQGNEFKGKITSHE